MRGRLARQACEPCRRRKIRCDAQRPGCGHCRASDIPCEYSSQRGKRGPKPRSSLATDGESTLPIVPASPIHPTGTLQQAQSPADDSPAFSSLASADRHTHPAQVPSPVETFHSPANISTPGIALEYEPHDRAQQVHQNLTNALEVFMRPLEETIEECIDKCMLSLFPTLPIFHPATLRTNSRLLLRTSRFLFEVDSEASEPRTNSARQSIMRDFTHLTALFAAVSCRRTQNTEEGQSEALTTAFLAATRGMMACCEDWDVSHADSSSFVIRVCQSTALHHLGKTRSSWLLLGQALRLAMDMRLFDEQSYLGLDPLESKLRRNIWGMLCTSDMSASVLNNRPLSYHEIYLDDIETTPVELRNNFSLLEYEVGPFDSRYEMKLYEGFYICQRVWKTATNMLLNMNILSRTRETSDFEVSFQDTSHMGIMQSYVDFCGILDSLPNWLHNPGNHIAGEEEATGHQRRAFWNQRADIVVTFHCLRLTLLQRASQKNLCALLGLTDNPDMLALQKVGIASDLASAATNMPFEALQANGEPLVEKLRRVGVSLLEITHQNHNRPISDRARILLSTIIDIIARLDSRVSDELSTQTNLA